MNSYVKGSQTVLKEADIQSNMAENLLILNIY